MRRGGAARRSERAAFHLVRVRLGRVPPPLAPTPSRFIVPEYPSPPGYSSTRVLEYWYAYRALCHPPAASLACAGARSACRLPERGWERTAPTIKTEIEIFCINIILIQTMSIFFDTKDVDFVFLILFVDRGFCSDHTVRAQAVRAVQGALALGVLLNHVHFLLTGPPTRGRPPRSRSRSLPLAHSLSLSLSLLAQPRALPAHGPVPTRPPAADQTAHPRPTKPRLVSVWRALFKPRRRSPGHSIASVRTSS